MERVICIGTNLDDEQTLFISRRWVLYRSGGPKGGFLGPKDRKISPENHIWFYFFKAPPSCLIFHSHALHWAPLL